LRLFQVSSSRPPAAVGTEGLGADLNQHVDSLSWEKQTSTDADDHQFLMQEQLLAQARLADREFRAGIAKRQEAILAVFSG
jgi:hypothetical protein